MTKVARASYIICGIAFTFLAKYAWDDGVYEAAVIMMIFGLILFFFGVLLTLTLTDD